MEADLPTEEELEWLETAEEQECLETETPTQSPPLSPPGCPPSPPPNPPDPSPDPNPRSSKRAREEQAADKDEDWLRYSPPQPQPQPQPPPKRPTRRTCISRFASDIAGDCFPITGPHGHRVYAQLNPTPPSASSDAAASTLLPHSIHTLAQRVDCTALSKALQDSVQSIPDADHYPVAVAAAAATEQLWVDKYAPSSFTDLLSDEHTNREVLLWLKQWDSLVFGSHLRATTDDVLSALRMHSTSTTRRNFFPSKHHSHRDVPSNNPNATPASSRSSKCSVDKPPEHKVPVCHNLTILSSSSSS